MVIENNACTPIVPWHATATDLNCFVRKELYFSKTDASKTILFLFLLRALRYMSEENAGPP